MPPTKAVLFQEADGSVPLVEWLAGQTKRMRAKCIAAIRRLGELGHEMHRPGADYLRDGIYELRLALGGIRYRVLYFFHGRTTVVLSHGFAKGQSKVPHSEIEQAIRRKNLYTGNPDVHTVKDETPWPE